MLRKAVLSAAAALSLVLGYNAVASATPYSPGSSIPLLEDSGNIQTIANKKPPRLKYDKRRGNRAKAQNRRKFQVQRNRTNRNKVQANRKRELVNRGRPRAQANRQANVSQKNANRKERRWTYNQRRNGPRYRARRNNYTYYNNGYYYSQPWWTLGPAVSLSIGVPSASYNTGSEHVQWCLDHYRSYSPDTDTYNGYDGYTHRCDSPYS